ncbi:50S ribosomal protein L10 [Furfurilactobacillus siliginis]|uniref:Large ribosomal subunit protein uL10 n=1 Tax=Furfurilactobacillus siliginis TaxID=348151 RepID=A0A0R2L354_9LACO|nr:50S ribosomal protein L10 [Furfurilactobacillus siliginis]KRN94246.1 50S ribosomal protein L10 [Furfurilactobacillus siliginis]GEK29371.1 50S ribosomal protein L10 [Furfurilactobacillus siliginis]
MSKETIAVKATLVDEVSKKITDANSLVVVDYRGLTVEEVTDLRKQLRDADVAMEVIKNKILTRAAEKAGFADLNDTFVGPTAVAFGNGDDSIAAARILAKFAKDHNVLEIKGGMMEGKVVSVDEINTYATLPSRDDLLSMLASELQSPIRSFAFAVKQVADNKDDEPAA